MEKLVTLFTEPSQDTVCREWITAHKANGFYLNARHQGNIKHQPNGMYLHRASCSHLDEDDNTTTFAKAVSESRDALLGWAQGADLQVKACSSCKPNK